MCKNYGAGLWKDGSSYSTPAAYSPLDKASPVLVATYTGQEGFTVNSGSPSSQNYYDSHNFIEFRYSEPVDIGDISADGSNGSQNIQSQTTFASVSEHGGALVNSGSSLIVSGFAQISSGQVIAGIKSGSSSSWTGTIDTAKPHSLYRKFSLTPLDDAENYPCRIRVSVAGYVDDSNPVAYDSSYYHNWVGYIDSASSPSGNVNPLANDYILDLAVDSDGTRLNNKFDSSVTCVVNAIAPADAESHGESSGSETLYGSWDVLPPVFATYVTNIDGSSETTCWTNGDSNHRQYELIGTVNSNTNAYIDKIEMHIFDNKQYYLDSDSYKWVSKKGWILSSSQELVSGLEAPESTGGSRPFSQLWDKSYGGIRRSSLAGAYSAFTYNYTLNHSVSEERTFAESDISQNVKSMLFRNEVFSETVTQNDGPYLGLSLNSQDSMLPIRTNFVVTYYPDRSFITDLAGNRLIQRDSDSDKKVLHTVDITPPSFMMTLSPVGENKIYAIFTKVLGYKGSPLNKLQPDLLNSLMEKIASNVEFVLSTDDDIDTDEILSGEDAIGIDKVQLVSDSESYTALLFTLKRKVTLTDLENVWIRINEAGEESDTIFGRIRTAYIQDTYGNAMTSHTCHALSDFAVNAVNVIYAHANSNDDGWTEEGIYGESDSSSDNYAVHDFSENSTNNGKVISGHDISFQYEFIDGKEDSSTAVKNNESLALIYDKKSDILSSWTGDRLSSITEIPWRIWLTCDLDSYSTDYNDSPLSNDLPSGEPEFTSVEGSSLLYNMLWKNSVFNLTAGNEYQFYFKILKDGNEITINHDGDETTARIPLYAFRMDEDKIAAGNFSVIDLWSIGIRDITKQRGGVTILNNVINASVSEKTAIEVDMKESGSLNVYVMTLDGNIVQRLQKGSVNAGTHFYYWDGKNSAGNPVARGLYFVRVFGKGIDETRKVMVVKE